MYIGKGPTATFFGGLVVFLLVGFVSAQTCPQTITSLVFNEVFYDDDTKTDIEFIEIYNPSAKNVDLSGWTLQPGIQYMFPAGSFAPAGGYVTICQTAGCSAVKSAFKVAETSTSKFLGPYIGKLSSADEVQLRDASAKVHTKISYSFEFPWPLTFGPTSIHLMTHLMKDSNPGSWKSGTPTPGAPSLQWNTASPPPQIASVAHHPKKPRSNQVVTIEVEVEALNCVKTVVCLYTRVAPGDYIGYRDARYNDMSRWTTVALLDDGKNGDKKANDGIYTVSIPASQQKHRHLMRYRIIVTDQVGTQVQVPYPGDPQTNFAYYTYDNFPLYSGKIFTGDSQSYTFNLTKLHEKLPMPVYQFLARDKDWNDSNWDVVTEDKIIRTWGTLVYDGDVFEDIGFRTRGRWAANRFGRGKVNLRFDFNKGHKFQPRDIHGNKLPGKWSELNTAGGVITLAGRQGWCGTIDTVTFDSFNRVGALGSITIPLHLRAVTQADEAPSNQYQGDFFGLHVIVEGYDSAFVDNHELVDGTVLKCEYPLGGSGGLCEYRNVGPGDTTPESSYNKKFFFGSSEFSDYSSRRVESNPAYKALMESRMDVDVYYKYLAMVRFAQLGDTYPDHNAFYYNNPSMKKSNWYFMPWDLDVSWNYENGHTDGGLSPNIMPIFHRTKFYNEMRSLMGLFFNDEQFALYVDRLIANIHPVNGAMTDSWCYAEAVKWANHPRYLNPPKGNPNIVRQYFKPIPGGTKTLFPAIIEAWRAWVPKRRDALQNIFLAESQNSIPGKPVVAYNGAAGHPADTLVFSSSAFVKRGSGNFHSIQWRIARVSFDINDLYLEVDAPGIWNVTQVAISNQPPPLQFPVWSVKPGNTYRVRCRHFDSNEWASEWSNPIEFVPKASTSALPKIIISEVMHSNTDWKGIVGDDLQYVELQNVGSTAADISRAKFDKDSEIEFEFPVGTVLQPQETIILTSDKFWFSQRYPSSCKVHKFKKSLGKKSGSKLILVDSSKRVIFDVSYMKKFPDFTGHSVITRPWGNTQVWSTSSAEGGSPCKQEPMTYVNMTNLLIITEINFNPIDSSEFLELKNAGPSILDLTGVSIDGTDFVFPQGFKLAPGDFAVIVEKIPAFQLRYPTAGSKNLFKMHGGLNKVGETLTVSDAFGFPIVSVTYVNTMLNGGSSPYLTLVPVQPNKYLYGANNKASWRPSTKQGGSPFKDDPEPPVNCVWGPWSGYGACSKSCDTGVQTQTRVIQTPAKYEGTPCVGDSTMSRPCNTQICPASCVGSWGDWTECLCSNPQQTRTYTIYSVAVNGGAPCPSKNGDKQTQPCQPIGCPVDCVGDWSGEWTNCSCTTSTQTRIWTTTTEAANGG